MGYSKEQIGRVLCEYELYAKEGRLDHLSNDLNIGKPNLCRLARKFGLTNKNRKRPFLVGRGGPKWNKEDGDGLPPHPRGMKGKFHSESLKSNMREKSKKNWEKWKKDNSGPMLEENLQRKSDMMSIRNSLTKNPYSRCKGGKRKDIGEQYFRSSWEANYARYLNLLIKMKIVDRWEFEPETFWFNDIKRGIRSYKPDFKVWYKGEINYVFVEIKGWMDNKSKTKIKRFQKYYPQHKLEIVDKKAYKSIKSQWSNSIQNWE